MHTDAADRELMHPGWCDERYCSAFLDEDRAYHRTKPLVLRTDDPHVALYIHGGADPNGSEPYVEISELESNFVGAFYWAPPVNSLVMPVDRSTSVRHILAALARVLG